MMDLRDSVRLAEIFVKSVGAKGKGTGMVQVHWEINCVH